ncbi:hypothetical protein CathTA2_0669 [Caldalkalibacillus thermarum TA2.A1]|uniref:Uncharacterized protein n=1 Tax=Caldalkalibacillus thermarum (strain TA2.A1) TaxID=986075 RepID=F5L4F7_CALTT|nr:hypothetical protein [Caldalkalibacillus thermarum]EGL83768.1 hypothetical protein CathTA2_0669 [Caldalkalibacillus thermarum TA2.A1]QZT33718.1 hypothetical protein HUR95_16085 [Caldalkalibacillus thermarum TA2.A1]
MLALEKLPRTWEEYQKEYERYCLLQTDRETTINNEVYQKADEVLDRWPGVKDYMLGFVLGGMYDEYVWDEMSRLEPITDQKERENGIMDIFSSHLGWRMVQITYMLAYLEHMRRKEGWGRALERVAGLKGHYDGLVKYFNELENNPVLEFDAKHPALYDFTRFFFRVLITEHLRDEEHYQKFLDALERRDEAERKQKLVEEWLEPLEPLVQGGMLALVGFLSRFEYHNCFNKQ